MGAKQNILHLFNCDNKRVLKKSNIERWQAIGSSIKQIALRHFDQNLFFNSFSKQESFLLTCFTEFFCLDLISELANRSSDDYLLIFLTD